MRSVGQRLGISLEYASWERLGGVLRIAGLQVLPREPLALKDALQALAHPLMPSNRAPHPASSFHTARRRGPTTWQQEHKWKPLTAPLVLLLLFPSLLFCHPLLLSDAPLLLLPQLVQSSTFLHHGQQEAVVSDHLRSKEDNRSSTAPHHVGELEPELFEGDLMTSQHGSRHSYAAPPRRPLLPLPRGSPSECAANIEEASGLEHLILHQLAVLARLRCDNTSPVAPSKHHPGRSCHPPRPRWRARYSCIASKS